MLQNNYFTYSDTPQFTDIWQSAEQFLTDYHNQDIKQVMTDEYVETLFYLLYSRYGNSNIAFTDTTQFKYNVYSIMFMYGPTWEERVKLQEKLRNLSDDEIRQGSKAIYNSSLNPGTQAVVNEDGEINFLNSQNTTNYKKSKLEGIALKWDMLATDVTSEFLNRFSKLFIKILGPVKAVTFSDINEGDTEQ